MPDPTQSGDNNQPRVLVKKIENERIRVLQKFLADVQNEDTLKHKRGRDFLARSDLMLDVLDSIKDIHPFIGIATLPFRITLKIVLLKQDSDKRIAALMVKMIDMMSPLMEMRNIVDTPRQTPTGDWIESSLTTALNRTADNIEDAGNLVDSYSKARPWHRVLHVDEWSAKFKDIAERFQGNKHSIQLALGIHTALSMDAKMDHVLVLMQECFLRPESLDERSLLDSVKENGAQKYLDNKADFIKLYQQTGSGGRARESTGGTFAEKPSDGSKDSIREAEEVWKEARKPLDTILSDNLSVFQALLEVQKNDLATTIRQSETTIIRAIHEGPHSYINHPDIRNLWKVMHWRLSVKTRHFVMALHDHYLHDTHTASYEGSADSSDHTLLSSTGDDLQGEPTVDPADKFYLQYLHIRYLPAISEAFDDDGSGFVRISEVNEFTDGIPKGWSLLKWVAYWTSSWPDEIRRYSSLIKGLIIQLESAQCDVKPENIESVSHYMNGTTLSGIKLLVKSVQPQDGSTPGDPESELCRLAAEMRLQTETYLRKNLEMVKYNIDDPDKLPLFCGPGRIEKYLFPLLYLLLERHLEIVLFASKYALDIREMTEAHNSLYHVLVKVYHRVQEMKESFRQQKFNINEHFGRFACGIYSRYARYADSFPSKYIGTMLENPARPSPASVDPVVVQQNDNIVPAPGQVGSEMKAKDPTRFGPVNLETSLYAQASSPTDDAVPWLRPLRVQYSEIGPRVMLKSLIQRVLERVQLLSPRLTWDHLKRRRSIRLRWIEIARRSDKEYIDPDKQKEWETSNEQERADLLAQVRPADIPYYDSLAPLQVRLYPEHLAVCDGCDEDIFGKRFKCLHCSDFDLCDKCEHAEIPRHDVVKHPDSHTMIQCNYPYFWQFNTTFGNRARKYLIKHSAQPCPCNNTEDPLPSGGQTSLLRCGGCDNEIKNGVHFRCLQCPDYDLCEGCEQSQPPQHFKAHALLKLKAPFLEQETEVSEDTDDDEQPLSVDARLDRLTQRVTDLETKLGGRFDELQKGFTGMEEWQKGHTPLDELQTGFARLDELQKGFARLDELQKGFARLDELQKELRHTVSLLEHIRTQDT